MLSFPLRTIHSAEMGASYRGAVRTHPERWASERRKPTCDDESAQLPSAALHMESDSTNGLCVAAKESLLMVIGSPEEYPVIGRVVGSSNPSYPYWY